MAVNQGARARVAEADLPYPPAECFGSLDDAEREARFQHMVAEIRDLGAVWVFAYGSLMWRPAFEPAQQLRARLPAYKRSFCFWTMSSRGSPQAPGLGLALEPAAQGCVGVAQRLDPERAHDQLRSLWEREMGSGVYHCRWVNLYLRSGAALRAITFVADPEHSQYAGQLGGSCKARIIARARGRWGACRDYLAGVVDALEAMNAPEAPLQQLLWNVDACAEASPGANPDK